MWTRRLSARERAARAEDDMLECRTFGGSFVQIDFSWRLAHAPDGVKIVDFNESPWKSVHIRDANLVMFDGLEDGESSAVTLANSREKDSSMWYHCMAVAPDDAAAFVFIGTDKTGEKNPRGRIQKIDLQKNPGCILAETAANSLLPRPIRMIARAGGGDDLLLVFEEQGETPRVRTTWWGRRTMTTEVVRETYFTIALFSWATGTLSPRTRLSCEPTDARHLGKDSIVFPQEKLSLTVSDNGVGVNHAETQMMQRFKDAEFSPCYRYVAVIEAANGSDALGIFERWSGARVARYVLGMWIHSIAWMSDGLIAVSHTDQLTLQERKTSYVWQNAQLGYQRIHQMVPVPRRVSYVSVVAVQLGTVLVKYSTTYGEKQLKTVGADPNNEVLFFGGDAYVYTIGGHAEVDAAMEAAAAVEEQRRKEEEEAEQAEVLRRRQRDEDDGEQQQQEQEQQKQDDEQLPMAL